MMTDCPPLIPTMPLLLPCEVSKLHLCCFSIALCSDVLLKSDWWEAAPKPVVVFFSLSISLTAFREISKSP